MRAARLFAIPRWTERVTLAGIGAWLLGYALVRALDAVNTAGAQLLAPIPTGPSSWRPAQPLGDLPFRIEAPLAMLTPLMLMALVALGLAWWPRRADRIRFLALLACLDALLVLAVARSFWSPPAADWMIFARHQLGLLPFFVGGLALAWSHRPARRLAFASLALQCVVYASVYWMHAGFPAGHWMLTPGALEAWIIGRDALRAAAPGLFGAALLAAARASTLGRGGSATRAARGVARDG